MAPHHDSQIHIIGLSFSSFTRSVQLLCEELQLDYSLGTEYQGQAFSLGSSALKQINPFSKLPVLILDEQPIYETQSILRYLDNRFHEGLFQSKDLIHNTLIDQWCSAISTQIDSVIVRNYLLEFRFPKGKDGGPDRENIQRAIPKLVEIISLLEQQLAEQDWLLGDTLTLADFLLAPMLHYLVSGPNNADLIGPNSNLRAYVARWLIRPAGQRVLVSPQRD